MNMIGWIGGSILAFLVGLAVDQGTTMSVAIASTASIYILVALVLAGAAILVPRRPAGLLVDES